MHLNELLKSNNIDFERERLRIETFFSKTRIVCRFYEFESLKKYIDPYFLNSKLRKTFYDVNDFLASFSSYWAEPSLEGLLLYCEVILNLMKTVEHPDKEADKLMVRIFENISILMDKTGHELQKDDEGIIFIVKKNALAVSTIEDINDKLTAQAILDYNRIIIIGNLDAKRKLLKQIGDFVEPVLQKRKETSDQMRELAEDVSFCLNNLNIRHNNKEGKHKKDILNSISSSDLEVLYDDTYRTCLLLIELDKQNESHERIKKMRKQIKDAKE